MLQIFHNSQKIVELFRFVYIELQTVDAFSNNIDMIILYNLKRYHNSLFLKPYPCQCVVYHMHVDKKTNTL